MINILLLSAGTNACYHFAKTIKEKFFKHFTIIGVDINEKYLIPTCNYIDKFYKAPYSTDKNYYGFILDICKKENVNYLLPSFDFDQKLFYPENDDLLNLNVNSFGVSKTSFKIYENKFLMNNFLMQKGFKIPQMYNSNDLDENTEYFIKPINGVGSQDVAIIQGCHLKKKKNSDILIQEKCFGPEITLECFNYNNTLRTIARERIATKSGVCIKTRLFNSEELHAIALKLIKVLKTPYCFNLQFMKNTNNENVITDVNLRLAGGMSLSAAAGWDEVSALAKIMLGKSEEDIFETLPQKIKSQYIVRAYTDIVTKVEKDVVAFDLDGTLLDSRKRHKVVLDDILKEYNIVLNTSDLIEFKRGNKNNIDYLLSKGIDVKLADEIQKKWIKHIEDEEYLTLDSLYPEAQYLLNEYRDNNLILITARTNEKAAINQIKNIGLYNKFEKIFVVPPDTNTYQKKAEILHNENAIIMIGDTLSDYKAAKIAKIDFKFHENGFHRKEVIGVN